MAVKLTLARLAYEAVREAVGIGGNDFTYEAFTRICSGDADDNTYADNEDYTDAEFKVWGAINSAFGRLQAYNVLPVYVEDAAVRTALNRNQYVDIPEACGTLENIYLPDYAGHFTSIPFRLEGKKAFFEGFFTGQPIVSVEYSKEIPHFTRDDIVRVYMTGETREDGTVCDRYEDGNIDLKAEYGLSAEAYEAVKQYAVARMNEDQDRVRSNDMLSYAENRMADLQRNAGHVQETLRRAF